MRPAGHYEQGVRFCDQTHPQFLPGGGWNHANMPVNMHFVFVLSSPGLMRNPKAKRSAGHNHWLGVQPPAPRSQSAPTGAETPASTAASSLDLSQAIACQKRQTFSRRQPGGGPGERNMLRVHRSEARLCTFIATSFLRVLRRPVASAQYLAMSYSQCLAKA